MSGDTTVLVDADQVVVVSESVPVPGALDAVIALQQVTEQATLATNAATATAEDRLATGEDRAQTGLDAQATAEDRVATGQDREQTGQDRQVTGDDREQTARDRAATAESAASAAHIVGGTFDPAALPATRTDGSALQAGDICFGTDGYEYARIGGAWVNQTAAAAASAAAALASQGAAATSETNAVLSAGAAAIAKTLAEAARDASFALGPKYVDEPTGRAAVADNVTFLVQGAGNIAAYEYRRLNSGASTLVATYPSKAFIDSITALLQSGGLQIYSGAGPIYPIACDRNGNMVLGYDSANNALVGAGLVAASSIVPSVESGLLGPAGQASFVGAGPIYPVLSDQHGKVLIGYDSANNVIVAPGLLTRSDVLTIAATSSTLTALANPPVAKAINHLLFYGESTSVGAKGTPVDSTTQPYSNVTFHGGPRAWTGAAWDFTAFKALVEDAVSPAPDGSTDRGETCCSGAANYATTLAAQENGLAPSSHVILASTAGHGGHKISNLVKGQAWYSTLTSHVSGAKALNADYGVHAIGLDLGINDAAVGAQTAYATYRAAVEQLQVDAEADIKIISGQTSPVYFLMNQISYAAATWPDEALAQLDLAQKNSKFVLVTPMYHIPTASDAVHNTADGYKWLGAYFGRAYKQLVIDGKRPKWLNPLSATIRAAVIRVRFDVPFAPLVLDTTQLAPATSYGFKVLDGATPATINSVAIDGSDVVITLSATPAGAVTVRYGLDYLGTGLNITGGASGNLRDSDPGTITVSGIVRPLFHVCPHFKLTATVLGE